MKKNTISDILNAKGREKLAMITAYDALFSKIFDPLVDMILIGDSLNMSFGGHKDTLCLTPDQMIYHASVVANSSKHALVVADMPFGTTIDEKTTLKNAIRLYKESGVDAVKIEGDKRIAPIIRRLSDEGIAVMGHIGLRPQLSRFEGGYKIKGRKQGEMEKMLEDAYAIESAGAFSLVIEGTLSKIATKITKEISIPTIGIGSGVDTDGQVLVWSDMLGFFDEFKPKFVKAYLNGAELTRNAVKTYVDEVKSNKFPSKEFEYSE
ncbi:MAG: 3-methyl-2-oxobutanoate hydroxymethyltransferase [Campylobacter sp.]|nr:3-methyl-2-oxobutanoate hydroxymethyltransferase [Campylobacter sp.]